MKIDFRTVKKATMHWLLIGEVRFPFSTKTSLSHIYDPNSVKIRFLTVYSYTCVYGSSVYTVYIVTFWAILLANT